MINTTAVINEMLKGYFTDTTGITDFSDKQVLNNGILVVNPNFTIIESGTPGVYVYSFIPTSTGRTCLVFQGAILAQVEVITKSIYSSLKNIEDESLGSWTWDKTLGELVLLRQDGTILAQFDVTDTPTTATRERTS